MLKNLGYLDDKNGNTLIVITSDNGGPVNGICDSVGSSNYPLRGGKCSVWEGGVRITGMIYGTSDIIPSSVRGSNYTQLMHAVDWYPTLLSAAGIDINDNINYTLDGKDQWNGIKSGNKDGNDKYFQYRDDVWIGYEVSTQSNLVNYNNTAYRYKWTKIINGTGGKPNSWYPPPSLEQVNMSMDIKWDGTMYNYDGYRLPIYLFNISTDPTEHFNVTDDDLLNEMYNRMLQVEKDGVPQAVPDKNCPPIVYPNNSVVGPYWWPWCGM